MPAEECGRTQILCSGKINLNYKKYIIKQTQAWEIVSFCPHGSTIQVSQTKIQRLKFDLYARTVSGPWARNSLPQPKGCGGKPQLRVDVSMYNVTERFMKHSKYSQITLVGNPETYAQSTCYRDMEQNTDIARAVSLIAANASDVMPSNTL